MEYISEQELFEIIREASQSFTQQEIADKLGVTQQAVSKMLKGDSSYLSLAVRWIQANPNILVGIESADGKPIRYYRIGKD